MTEFLNDLLFIFQRLNWTSVFDILLVTLIFYILLYSVRDTQAMALVRGIIFLIVLIVLMTSLINLPAFSWLVTNTLPALVLAIPVIFAPEIRRTLERIGRAGAILPARSVKEASAIQNTITAVVKATARLSARQHGALIIMQRFDNLDEYIDTGVKLQALVTPELLLQIFYPNTPLHDGAAIISGDRVIAGSCVMPLSASGILTGSPERQMGLRHRAALGISEVSDAIAVVVSEETGSIAIAHAGRMIRRLDSDRLKNILLAFYQQSADQDSSWIRRVLPFLSQKNKEE
ncbi:MAG: diadenylate cyclase CdaA [Anaerolineales bacterium]|nr:diadenylate cyclase CdaA [Anaerolineales bacterium]